MTRTMKFSSATLGMVLLAGLAYYQGDVDPTRAHEEILTGTVLADSARNRVPDCNSPADSATAANESCAEASAASDSGR